MSGVCSGHSQVCAAARRAKPLHELQRPDARLQGRLVAGQRGRAPADQRHNCRSSRWPCPRNGRGGIGRRSEKSRRAVAAAMMPRDLGSLHFQPFLGTAADEVNRFVGNVRAAGGPDRGQRRHLPTQTPDRRGEVGVRLAREVRIRAVAPARVGLQRRTGQRLSGSSANCACAVARRFRQRAAGRVCSPPRGLPPPSAPAGGRGSSRRFVCRATRRDDPPRRRGNSAWQRRVAATCRCHVIAIVARSVTNAISGIVTFRGSGEADVFFGLDVERRRGRLAFPQILQAGKHALFQRAKGPQHRTFAGHVAAGWQSRSLRPERNRHADAFPHETQRFALLGQRQIRHSPVAPDQTAR